MRPWLRRCASCNEKLGNEPVVFLDESAYHASHFKCHVCQKVISISEDFHALSKDRIVCISCFSSNFAPTCSGCHKGIIDNCVRVAGQNFHQECFVCKSCGIHLTGNFFVDGNGNFVDRDCFWQFRLLKYIESSKQNASK
ncbi:Four and a half LIM domains protein 3 [Aphelenchoides bicaudatus]|nr:Four and a half LIM domains protein 3 [Aphelenchoides bicaudatus]